MDLFLQVFLILGLTFLLIKEIKAIYSITIQEQKSKPLTVLIAFIFALILIVGFYFSETIFHYLLSLLGGFVVLLNPYTSGISKPNKSFIHNYRSEVLFLSFPQEVEFNNTNKIEVENISSDKFAVTYFYNKRYNELIFSKDKKNEVLELLKI